MSRKYFSSNILRQFKTFLDFCTFYTLASVMLLVEIMIQSTLVIVDTSVGGKMSTITSNSTITGEIHTKIDNRSAKSVHYNEKFHYYGVHYYERRLYLRNYLNINIMISLGSRERSHNRTSQNFRKRGKNFVARGWWRKWMGKSSYYKEVET